MKKNYSFLILFLSVSVLFSQNNDFNNLGGDFLWSNASNWSSGVPTSSSIVRSSISGSLVDSEFTVSKIQNLFGTTNDVSFGGAGTVTINPGVANAYGIENVSNSDVSLSFAGNVTINNPAGFTYMRNQNGNTNEVNNIEFENGSTLTLMTNLAAEVGTGGDAFYYNGTLAGSGNLRFAAGTSNIFGSTASNAGYNGDLVFLANSQVIVNTADNNTFYNGTKLQVNGTGASIELNGANVFTSNIVIGGTNTFGFIANENQNNMGVITFSDAGTLNMTVNDIVTNLTFSDTSGSSWNTGTLNIIGFKDGVIRFGTDDTGLTADQLSKITIDGVNTPVILDANGYLVNLSLSVDDFNKTKSSPIAYPTLASDKIYFSELQGNVKIFDLHGKLLSRNTSANQSEIAVDFLSAGLYLIVFDNQKVEKFLKK